MTIHPAAPAQWQALVYQLQPSDRVCVKTIHRF